VFFSFFVFFFFFFFVFKDYLMFLELHLFVILFCYAS